MRTTEACDGLCHEGWYWMTDALQVAKDMLAAGVVVDRSNGWGASSAIARYVEHTGNYNWWYIALAHSVYVTASRGQHGNISTKDKRPGNDCRQLPCHGCWFHAVGRDPSKLSEIIERLERHVAVVLT